MPEDNSFYFLPDQKTLEEVLCKNCVFKQACHDDERDFPGWRESFACATYKELEEYVKECRR